MGRWRRAFCFSSEALEQGDPGCELGAGRGRGRAERKGWGAGGVLCVCVRACSLWEQAQGPGGAARLPVPGTLRRRPQAEAGREREGRLGLRLGCAPWCALRVKCKREGRGALLCASCAGRVMWPLGSCLRGLWSPGCVSWLCVCVSTRSCCVWCAGAWSPAAVCWPQVMRRTEWLSET